MKFLNYVDVLKRIKEVDSIIFSEVSKNNLSPFEKREIIYNFLVTNLVYDYDCLENIKNRGPRNLIEELRSVLYNFKGVCNGISQTYKLLLEYNGIYSVCVNTMLEFYEDGEKKALGHQLNLVYDKENDIFSFDDVTLPLLTNINLNHTFDYGLEDAEKLGQGTISTDLLKEKWLVLPSYIIDLYIGSNNEFYKKFGYENEKNLKIGDLKNIKKQKRP